MCPEKGQIPKRAQIGPILNFPVFQVEIPRNHGHRPNFKRNRFKFLHLELTELSVPKLPPPPKPLFSEGNWKFGRWQSADIKQAAELAKFQIRPTPGLIVTGLHTFGPKNGAMPKTHCATSISRILLGAFCTCGGSNQVLKIWAKLTWPIWCESVSKFGTQNFNGPKKEN